MLIDLFINSTAVEELGLKMAKASKPINMRFAKDMPHQTSYIVTDEEVKYREFSFVEDFIVHDMDGLDFILGNTFLNTYEVDMQQ